MLYKIDDRRVRLMRSEVLKDAILRHENVSDFLDLSLLLTVLTSIRYVQLFARQANYMLLHPRQ